MAPRKWQDLVCGQAAGGSGFRLTGALLSLVAKSTPVSMAIGAYGGVDVDLREFSFAWPRCDFAEGYATRNRIRAAAYESTLTKIRPTANFRIW